MTTSSAQQKSASKKSGASSTAANKPRRTQKERTDESRRKLLDAAMELFGEQGYQGTTLAGIGRRAGVSRGLVTYHFGTKEACLREMIARIQTSTQVFADVESSNKQGLAALDHLLTSYMSGYLAGSPGARAFFVAMVESFTSTPEVSDLMRMSDEHFRSVVVQYLREAVELGEVAEDLDLPTAALMIVGVCRGIGLQWLVDDECAEFDVALESLLRVVRDTVTRSTT